MKSLLNVLKNCLVVVFIVQSFPFASALFSFFSFFTSGFFLGKRTSHQGAFPSSDILLFSFLTTVYMGEHLFLSWTLDHVSQGINYLTIHVNVFLKETFRYP